VQAVNADKPQALFVLGMHRSGTSAMARMCNLLGYDLGQDLLEPRDDNKSGFWENAAFVKIHEKMLDELGIDWRDYVPFDQDWAEQDAIVELRQDLARACQAQFLEMGYWCVKDPRVCRLFPLWRSVCNELEVTPKVILMFRHPAAVAASIGKRNDVAGQDALLAWLKYNLDAIAAADGLAVSYVSFESFQQAWRDVAHRIAKDIETEWPTSVDEAAEEMDAFFDPKMIHHRPQRDLDGDTKIVGWCQDLYDALILAGQGNLNAANEIFVQIADEFAHWEDLVSVATSTIKNIRRQNAHLFHVEAELVTANEIISEREAWIEILREEVAELHQIHKLLSWEIMRPLRYLERGIKRFTDPIPYKAFAFCRAVYRGLPLPHEQKVVLRAVFFRSLTFLKLSGAGRFFGFLKKTAVPNVNDRTIDFRFVEYRAPRVSIIVPVYNEVHYTINCLRSISRCMPQVSFEVIVADDLSTDDTHRVIGQIPGVRYFRNRKNLGFLKNCNNAASAARGEYLYLLNNDTQVQPGFLDELVRELDEHPDVGLAGSKLIFADGMLQEAGGVIWQDASGWNVGRGEDPNAPKYNYRRDVDYCSGCSIIVRKSAWDLMGGFDDRFAPAYYEDTDLAFQLRDMGYRTVYQPLSRIVHFEGVSSGTDITSGVKAYQVENQKKFLEKWQSIISDHGVGKESLPVAFDRVATRKILIVDSITPTPDQDAGSLRTFNMIRMLVDAGCKVTFIPEDNIEYIEEFTPNLQRMGVECLYYPYVTSVQRYLKSSASDFDAIFLERGPVATKYVGTIKSCAPGVPIFFDTHDLHYLRIARQAEVEDSKLLRTQSESMKLLEYGVMKSSDCTIVVSQVEKQIIEKEAPHVRTEVLPLFMEADPLGTRFEQRSGLLFIGGFRHQPNGDAVHFFVREIWPKVKREIPDAVFHIIGPDVPPDITALASEDIIVEGFVSDLRPLFSKCRLSVAPLRFGAGVKGKIGTALAHGLPSVISSIAQEGSGLVAEEHVLVADRPEDFAEHVVRLYQDRSLWQSLSKKGIQFIEDNYSLAVNQKRIEALLDEFAPLTSTDHQDGALEPGSDVPVIHAAELRSDRV